MTATSETKRRMVTINDEPTIRIVEAERDLTGAATLSSAARSLILEAKAIRDQRRATQPNHAAALTDPVPAPAPNSP